MSMWAPEKTWMGCAFNSGQTSFSIQWGMMGGKACLKMMQFKLVLGRKGFCRNIKLMVHEKFLEFHIEKIFKMLSWSSPCKGAKVDTRPVNFGNTILHKIFQKVGCINRFVMIVFAKSIVNFEVERKCSIFEEIEESRQGKKASSLNQNKWEKTSLEAVISPGAQKLASGSGAQQIPFQQKTSVQEERKEEKKLKRCKITFCIHASDNKNAFRRHFKAPWF